jgi:hypothetical protein
LNGSPVNVGWGIDHGNIGTVNVGPASSSTFTPTGTTGGTVNVIAGLNGMTLSRSVLVKLNATQNGADPNNPLEKTQIPTVIGDLTKGGGVGGVGGEGLGPAAAAGDVTALGMPVGNGSTQNLKFLYPYDQTVWPRGLLAPLLQWSWSMGDADAIQIELFTTTGSFSYKGTFGKPAILSQTGGTFIRHPIPQDIWLAATNTAGGTDKLTVKLTVAKGGKGRSARRGRSLPRVSRGSFITNRTARSSPKTRRAQSAAMECSVARCSRFTVATPGLSWSQVRMAEPRNAAFATRSPRTAPGS